MKRLLCIISSLNTGGAETFLMKLSRAIPFDQYQLDFVVSEKDGYYTDEVLQRGGKIFYVPMRTKNLMGAFWEIASIVKKNGYGHALKLTDSPIGVVDLIAARVGGAKVLAARSCNALTNLSLKRRIVDAVFRPVLNRVVNVKIAPSDLAAAYTFGQKQIEKGNVCFLNNGLNLEAYCYDVSGRIAIRKEFSIEGKTVIGHIGRFSKQKNHKFLLDIFSRIRQQKQEAVLLLVGAGELEQEVRQQAEKLGLTDCVYFTGVRSDVAALLSAMDVFVFPSFHEGMPNTVIEAQATGLPCVIADTITKSADVTGLVQYLSLSLPAEEWARIALKSIEKQRGATHSILLKEKYDINRVAEQFLMIIFDEN